jgi:Trypsin-like peptidase domain
MPQIIGTGFVVDARGVIATNRHVVEAIQNELGEFHQGESRPEVILFVPCHRPNQPVILNWIYASIEGFRSVTSFHYEGTWYGSPVPDIGFLKIGIRDLPALPLATTDYYVRTGMQIATIGFPLGTQTLRQCVQGQEMRTKQVSPFLRAGLVSSVYPYDCPQPHGFTIDVLMQGGTSGSPVIRVADHAVIGVMASSSIDFENIEMLNQTTQLSDSFAFLPFTVLAPSMSSEALQQARSVPIGIASGSVLKS